MIHQESIEPSYFPWLSIPIGREANNSHIWLNSINSAPPPPEFNGFTITTAVSDYLFIRLSSIQDQISRFNPSVTTRNWVAILFWVGHQESCDLSRFAAPVCARYQLFARRTIYIKCSFMNLKRHVIFIIPWHFEFTGHLT